MSQEDDETETDDEETGIWSWIEDKMFYILHRNMPFYSTMRENFYPKYVKAPFLVKHKDKFIGSDRKDFFTTSERSTVVYRLLQQAPYHKEGNREFFGVDELVANGSYKAAYPLHDGPYETDPHDMPSNHRQLLRFYWASFRRWNKHQPLNLIRMYFGEKVGMYFAWTGFYTQSLFIPAIVGVLVFGYSQMGNTPLRMSVNNENDDDVCYTFIIQTGSNDPKKESTKKWNDGSLILTLNPGSRTSASEELRVKENFDTQTEGAVTADFWLPSKIGVPKLLKVDLESNMLELIKDALFIKEITVIYNRDCYRFPVRNYLYPHHPIHNPSVPRKGCLPHLHVREGAGTLKHQETEEFLIKAREEDLKTTKSLLKWNKSKYDSDKLLYSGFLDVMEYEQLPRFLQFKDANYDLVLGFRESGRDEIRSRVFEHLTKKILGTYKANRFASFQEFELYLKHKSTELGWPKENITEAMKVAKNFRKDEEFGRQMLCGPNAQQIRNVRSLEGRWAGHNLPSHATEGKSIQDLLEAGKLYEVTNDIMDGVPHGGGFSKTLTGTKQTWYSILADCMLYVRDDGKLVPVLIRLENKNDGKPATWWSPPEPEITDEDHPKHLAWLYAKMWFRSIDLNNYVMGTHYSRGHAINETIAVGAFRNLPRAHPIFRVLQPHIQGIIPVNANAREVIVSPGKNAFSLFLAGGDAVDKVFHNYFKTFTYDQLVVPLDIEQRGVQDIPEYLFRDDMMSHWEILHQYLTEMVDLTYLSDEDVVKDVELQNFFQDVADNGFRGFENSAGFPRSVSNKEKLVEFLTVSVLNVSVFHTAVNFQTFTYMTFMPNIPSCMSQPPPDQDTVVTMELILDSLPLLEIAFYAMTLSNLLGAFSPIERFFLGDPGQNRLGMIGENMAVSPAQEACIRSLVERMRGLKETIDERNRGRYFKYDVMRPDNVPITAQA
ncbi:hypothetical protein ACHWQZ_G015068 [Mnemiopsis leidyi]